MAPFTNLFVKGPTSATRGLWVICHTPKRKLLTNKSLLISELYGSCNRYRDVKENMNSNGFNWILASPIKV